MAIILGIETERYKMPENEPEFDFIDDLLLKWCKYDFHIIKKNIKTGGKRK